jgi:hypothetical protein
LQSGGVAPDMRSFPTLRRLARRVTAPVDPAHALGALLVAGLLLSAFVTDDALVMSLGRLLPILLAFLDRLSPGICPMICLL